MCHTNECCHVASYLVSKEDLNSQSEEWIGKTEEHEQKFNVCYEAEEGESDVWG